jgi:hypothetical protein
MVLKNNEASRHPLIFESLPLLYHIFLRHQLFSGFLEKWFLKFFYCDVLRNGLLISELEVLILRLDLLRIILI